MIRGLAVATDAAAPHAIQAHAGSIFEQSLAKAGPPPGPGGPLRQYVVRRGDSLSSIAASLNAEIDGYLGSAEGRRHHITVQELLALNPQFNPQRAGSEADQTHRPSGKSTRNPDQLHVGETLLVPDPKQFAFGTFPPFRFEAVPVPRISTYVAPIRRLPVAPQSMSPGAVRSPKTPSRVFDYTVAKGDTFSNLASRINAALGSHTAVSVGQLVAMNPQFAQGSLGGGYREASERKKQVGRDADRIVMGETIKLPIDLLSAESRRHLALQSLQMPIDKTRVVLPRTDIQVQGAALVPELDDVDKTIDGKTVPVLTPAQLAEVLFPKNVGIAYETIVGVDLDLGKGFAAQAGSKIKVAISVPTEDPCYKNMQISITIQQPKFSSEFLEERGAQDAGWGRSRKLIPKMSRDKEERWAPVDAPYLKLSWKWGQEKVSVTYEQKFAEDIRKGPVKISQKAMSSLEGSDDFGEVGRFATGRGFTVAYDLEHATQTIRNVASGLRTATRVAEVAEVLGAPFSGGGSLAALPETLIIDRVLGCIKRNSKCYLEATYPMRISVRDNNVYLQIGGATDLARVPVGDLGTMIYEAFGKIIDDTF